MNVYTLANVEVGETVLGGITTQAVNPGLSILAQSAGGQTMPTFACVQAGDPIVTFTTHEIAAALAITGMAGLALSGDLYLYFVKLDYGGARASGSVHMKCTVHDGLLAPGPISVNHRGEAQMSFTVYATDDAVNGALSIAAALAPATTGQSAQKFTAGPVDLNGTDYTVSSMTLDPGLRIVTRGYSGELFPFWAGIMGRAPMFRFTTPDGGKLATITPEAGLTITASEWYLRKKSLNGGNVAAATAQHIKITTTTGLATVANASSGHQGHMITDVMLRPTFDGSNDICVVSTTSAIT